MRQCKSVGKGVFSAQTQQMKVTLNAEPALVVTVFGFPITKIQISKIHDKVLCKHKIKCSRF